MFTRRLLLYLLSISAVSLASAQVKKTTADTKADAVIKSKTAVSTPVKSKTTSPVVKSKTASTGKSNNVNVTGKTRKVNSSALKSPAGEKTDSTHTLLWEISGNGLTQPSYLFGTMHILCADDAKLSATFKKTIKDCGQVFFEVDMDDMQQLMGGLGLARMKDGTKLSDLLTPVELEKVKDYFDQRRSILPFAMMNRFKPYFISSIISEGMMDCEKKKGMEELIMKESKLYDKNIRGLETVEFQASIFDTIPYEKQAKDLVMYIDSIDSYKKTTLEMVDVYRQQDLNRLDSLITKSDPRMTEYMDMLLYDRNARWASEMPEHMREMPTLFAVGAGHLPGKKGVINLLIEQGFTVKPLQNRD